MESKHAILFQNAENVSSIKDNGVDLIVTSPPYPMIEMWDQCFSNWDPTVQQLLDEEKGPQSFEAMHYLLDQVWKECARVLRPGGFACINIGDATRKIGDNFQLYSNHTRIIQSFLNLGFQCMPMVIWKKQTNSPNKYMGSGMMPPGAYVTLGHEFILIFRKGEKRTYSSSEMECRRESAFFWEERNQWYLDTWEFKGVRQKNKVPEVRKRSAAFPLEVAHRLINMYSLQNDLVYDPFAGTGTTMHACMMNQRNSISTEVNPALEKYINTKTIDFLDEINEQIDYRLNEHKIFIHQFQEERGIPKHFNDYHNFHVVTAQESKLKIRKLSGWTNTETNRFICKYKH